MRQPRRISHRTLFYIREYGPRAHVACNIVRESVKVLLLASVISSIGGIGLQLVQEKFIGILPLLILLPALNDMIGDFGTVIGSKFTVGLFKGYIRERWWRSHFLRDLVLALLAIAAIASVWVGGFAVGISIVQGWQLDIALASKIIMIALAATFILTCIVCLVSVIGGLAVFRRREDPNNFLIPMTTSIADLGSMLLLAVLVSLLF